MDEEEWLAMSESDWLACTDLPNRMLAFLDGKASERKLRLYACAIVRRIWHLLVDDRSCKALELAEQFADGLCSERVMCDAHIAANRVQVGLPDPAIVETHGGFYDAAAAVCYAAYSGPCDTNSAFQAHQNAGQAECYSASPPAEEDEPTRTHTNLLRDIFGNPFRPVALDRAWQTPTILALAHAAYDNRILPAGTLDPARLAVLADALEEAGCDNGDMLNHCRQPGEHVRGCWVVDLILGKE